MSTVTEPTSTEAKPSVVPIQIGPEHHGLAMDFDAFTEADFREGWLYELARGIVDVTEVPGTPHGWTVRRVARLFDRYDEAHPGRIHFRGGGGECRLRLPGMKCDRHPDQAIYLHPKPLASKIWTRWVPEIVVEIVLPSSDSRDYVQKREEYLRAGILEYWILDLKRRRMLVLIRMGDTWEERLLGEDGVHRTELLPGLEARVGELLGPAV